MCCATSDGPQRVNLPNGNPVELRRGFLLCREKPNPRKEGVIVVNRSSAPMASRRAGVQAVAALLGQGSSP